MNEIDNNKPYSQNMTEQEYQQAYMNPIPELKPLGTIPSADNILHVVAGNIRQAKVFARKYAIYPKYWQFVGRVADVKGAEGSLVYIGTFFQRPDISEIKAEVDMNQNLKVLDYDERQ